MDAPETDTCGPESVDCGGADLDVAISASNSTFPPEAIIFGDVYTFLILENFLPGARFDF